MEKITFLLILMLIEIIVLIIALLRVKNKHPKQKFKNLKPEQYFIFLIYAVVIGIFAYFLIGNLSPNIIPKIEDNFVISASSIQIFDKLSSFYIDKDNILGSKETIDNQTVRKIASAEPFNLIVKPKTPIKENSSAMLEINLMINEGLGTDVYMDDKLIIPNLVDYENVGNFGNEAVYVSKNLKEYYNLNNFVKSENAQEFIYKNFPGASIYSFSNSNVFMPNLDDYKKDWTNIDSTFRDNLKLAVYTEGNLEIKFTKQDLNNNIGKDEYTVEIKDLSGKVYFSKIYEDDGDKIASKKLGTEQDFKISVDNLPKGIYYVSFIKDKYNSASDSTIKEISVNSNKVIILGTFLPITPFNFYTKVIYPKKIGFNYWHKQSNQTIKIDGPEKIKVVLDEEVISQTKTKNLTIVGDYNIISPKGDLLIYSDYISPKKENWFNIPKQNEGNLKNQDIIIIDKNKLKIDEDKIQYKEDIIVNKDTKIKLQVIDENQIYLESIKLNLK